MSINDLTKNEMATYLYVRDILRNEADIDDNYINIYDAMMYIMPWILIIIFILILILFYRMSVKNNMNEY